MIPGDRQVPGIAIMLYFIGQTLDMYGQVGNFLIADTDVVLLQQQRPDLFGTAQGLRIALPHLVVKEIIFRIQHIAGIKPLYKELQVGNKPCQIVLHRYHSCKHSRLDTARYHPIEPISIYQEFQTGNRLLL